MGGSDVTDASNVSMISCVHWSAIAARAHAVCIFACTFVGCADDSGDADAADDKTPKCLRDVRAECPLEPACFVELMPENVTSICYPEGVKERRRQLAACSGNVGEARWRTEVLKRDGSLCYAIDSSCSCWQACEAGSSTYTDGRSQTFLIITNQTYTCRGEEGPVNCGEDGCGGVDNSPLCELGACPLR